MNCGKRIIEGMAYQPDILIAAGMERNVPKKKSPLTLQCWLTNGCIYHPMHKPVRSLSIIGGAYGTH